MEYRETTKTIQEKTWRRHRSVTFDHPIAGGISVVFRQESVTQLDGVVTATVPAGEFSEQLAPGTTQFPLLNPADGLPTGRQLTYAELRAALYSLYRFIAAQRDGGS